MNTHCSTKCYETAGTVECRINSILSSVKCTYQRNVCTRVLGSIMMSSGVGRVDGSRQ